MSRLRAGRPLAVAAAAGAGVAGYASLVERSSFRLRRWQIPVLPAGTAPLRVLHLSDVHLRPAQARKRAFIAGLARLAPDLVVCTGDNLAARDAEDAVLATYAPLLSFPGVFVLGSNDYYAPKPKNPLKYFFPGHKRVHGDPLDAARLAAGLRAAGWLDLTNTRAELTVAGVRVDLRGVDDPHLKRDRPDLVAGPPVPGTVLALGVVHAPEPAVLDRFVGDGVQLMLSGHTHGGQLRLPGVGALVTNCGIDRDRCRWVSAYGPAWLHVSAGLGTSPYAPARLLCPPEATLLTLTPAGT